MDPKERLEKIKIIALKKIKTYDFIEDKNSERIWRYMLDLLNNDSWLNERYDFYTLTDEEFVEKYSNLYN